MTPMSENKCQSDFSFTVYSIIAAIPNIIKMCLNVVDILTQCIEKKVTNINKTNNQIMNTKTTTTYKVEMKVLAWNWHKHVAGIYFVLIYILYSNKKV